jgi:hypothetical protein
MFKFKIVFIKYFIIKSINEHSIIKNLYNFKGESTYVNKSYKNI